jgi:hypothetical protein
VRSANSCANKRHLTAIAAALWLCVAPLPFSHSQTAADGQAPSDDDITAAIEKLKADPNLATERTTRTLRWAGKDKDEDRPKEPSSFGAWIANFFVWLAQVSRALVWVLGGLLALGLAWFLFSVFRSVGPAAAKKTAVVPTHVRDLDIRPESLPDDIGAAALDLWQRGEHRAALALLYRGLLSRLAHVHQVPIRDSSTEGDCLALAAQHLPADRTDYVSRLIGVWQRATYGGHDPAVNDVQTLCAGFDKALAPTSASASAPSTRRSGA